MQNGVAQKQGGPQACQPGQAPRGLLWVCWWESQSDKAAKWFVSQERRTYRKLLLRAGLESENKKKSVEQAAESVGAERGPGKQCFGRLHVRAARAPVGIKTDNAVKHFIFILLD